MYKYTRQWKAKYKRVLYEQMLKIFAWSYSHKLVWVDDKFSKPFKSNFAKMNFIILLIL